MEWKRTAIAGVPALRWDAGQPRGLVLSLHGLGGTKEDIRPEWVSWAQGHGLSLITMDAYLHGERAPAGFDPRSEDSFRPELLLEILSRTAREVVEILAELRSETGDAIALGLRGGSMGGIIALAACGLGAECDCLLSICGCADYARSFPNLYEQAPRDLDPALIAGVDPIFRPQAFPPRPVLMIHGLNDPVVPIAGARALFELLAPFYAAIPDRCVMLTHAGGHETPDELEWQGWRWLLSRLRVEAETEHPSACR